MTMPDPVTLTQSSLAQVGAPVAAAAASNPLEGIEGMIQLLDKFMSGIQKYEATIQRLRGFEQGPQQAQGESPAQTTQPDSMHSTVKPIDPAAVYARLLGQLNQLVQVSPDMTVSDALTLAREHKAAIMPQIEAMIAELTA